MKFTRNTVNGINDTILASNDYTAIPFTVAETATVKAGYPMTKAGKKATSATADGILLYDVDPAAIAAYWTNDPTNAMPFASDALFPAKKKAGLDLKWLRGHKGVGVSLMPSAFDAKATFRTREGFKFDETEMPFFREGYHLGEKDRQEILRVLDSNDPYARDVMNRLYDDTAQLITGARIVPERMIWQLLAPIDGVPGITIKANGVNYTYNYDPDGTWTSTNYRKVSVAESKWNLATATPIADLNAAKDAVLASVGEVVTEVYMNTATFRNMIAADEVKNRFMTVTAKANAVLLDAEARQIVESATGLTIHLYDKMFKADQYSASEKYLPDGMVVVAPSGALGSTWYGTTPEEADLLSGQSGASVSIVNTGVAITTELTVHPVNANVYASEIVLPSFERMDAVYCIKAY